MRNPRESEEQGGTGDAVVAMESLQPDCAWQKRKALRSKQSLQMAAGAERIKEVDLARRARVAENTIADGARRKGQTKKRISRAERFSSTLRLTGPRPTNIDFRNRAARGSG
jgi:hypothetical protein